ncbi:MAG: hypothetical protein WKF51_05090 [Geodermatophilaceae bacterium]
MREVLAGVLARLREYQPVARVVPQHGLDAVRALRWRLDELDLPYSSSPGTTRPRRQAAVEGVPDSPPVGRGVGLGGG